MKITTKKGDKGKTSLYGGKRVSKDSLRIEACGTADELNSFLGVSKSLMRQAEDKKVIEEIQKSLLVIGSEIATPLHLIPKLKERINQDYVRRLENYIEKMEKEGLGKDCFCLPGENVASANLDLARAVARRLERRAVTLKGKGRLKNTYLLIYLNRLSDLLYLMARKWERLSVKG